jgi:hypothetical protein
MATGPPEFSNHMRRFRNVVHTLTGLALVTAAGCGGDSTSPQATVSRAEARAIASAVFANLARAVGSPTPTSTSNNVAALSAAAGPTVTASIRANCSNGGTIAGTFNLTSDVNANGNGTVSGAVSVAAASCNIDTGERVIAVDGGFDFNFNVGVSNHLPSSDFVWVATGTLVWTGGSCTLDYTVRIARNGARTVTGTVCGVDVRGTMV